MIVVKYTQLIENLEKYLELAGQGEQILIQRNDKRNVFILSETEYKELKRVKENEAYLAKLDRAIAQKEDGSMLEHELMEK